MCSPPTATPSKCLLGDFVSTEEGTGIVHIAPSFGADDMKVGRQYGMGTLTLVDTQGKFVDAVTDFAGRYVKDYKDEGDAYENVDVDIAVLLKRENKAFNIQKYEHNYPHCWRTDKPVLYYPWTVGLSSRRHVRTAWWNSTKPSTGSPHTPARTLRQLAGKPAGLEPLALALLGHAASHLAHR